MAKTFYILDNNFNELVNFDIEDDEDADAVYDALTMVVGEAEQNNGVLNLTSAYDSEGCQKDLSLIDNNCCMPGFVETIPTLKLNYAQLSGEDVIGQADLDRIIIPLRKINTIPVTSF